MHYRLVRCAFVGMVWSSCASYAMDNTVQISLSRENAHTLVKTLETIVVTRASRPDSFTPASPAYPVSSLSLAELEAIKIILCSIQQELAGGSTDNNVGNLTDDGSCFASIISVLDIDDAQLNVIQWLKTLMRELRGVCT